jgi:predicted nuclease with RNAse H fold
VSVIETGPASATVRPGRAVGGQEVAVVLHVVEAALVTVVILTAMFGRTEYRDRGLRLLPWTTPGKPELTARQ